MAEQRLLEEDHRQFDSAWQEMLNHATQRQLEKKLKRTISKSKPYFEMKAKCYLQLENLKRIVDERQARLSRAKGEYKMALRNLEKISDEIHERRRSSSMGPRGRGVGSEGHSVSGDDGSNFKMESDRISMASVCFEPIIMSEEESETRSPFSLVPSPSSPQELLSPCPFDSSSSSSSSSSPSPIPTPPPLLLLPLPLLPALQSGPPLLHFGLISPVLGPRSECSGASSPECDLERGDRAEGAEGDLDNAPPSNNNNNTTPSSSSSSSSSSTKRSFSLETRFSFLNLRRPRSENAKNSDKSSKKADQTEVSVKGL
ncbi:hypothetical protein F7725_017823 [Dissostichus mawsoni]|uniref:SH3 domain-binding protein 5 n=1 Tax=Dissostichus mawsoni TaxID=36200 RepID=A0A7J5XPP9_DISMA|nr:hypothetical protein F7725_017823 [Dissostichus mawsoni]